MTQGNGGTGSVPAGVATGALAGSWEDVEGRLAWSLRELPVDAYLIVERALPGDTDGSHFVQFARTKSGLLGEAVSNLYLSGERRLDAGQDARLAGMGWDAPQKRSKHRRNWRRTWPAPVPFEEASALAVRALREVYGVGSPADLRYSRFARGGARLPDPGLGIAPVPSDAARTPSAASTETRRTSAMRALGRALEGRDGVSGLAESERGEWRFVFDGTSLRAKTIDGPIELVRVYTVVVDGVAPTDGLLRHLNKVNVELLAGRVLWLEGAVIVAFEVPGGPLDLGHLDFACQGTATIGRHVAEDMGPHLRPRAFEREPETRLN